MATSGLPKDQPLTETTIMLPRKEMTHPLDPDEQEKDEQLAFIELDGSDPINSDVPASDYVMVWKETKGTYKVHDAKTLQFVVNKNGTIHYFQELPKTTNMEESPKSDACQKHSSADCRRCQLQKMNEAWEALHSDDPEDPMLQVFASAHDGPRRPKNPLAGTAPATAPSKSPLSTNSTKCADARAKEARFEIVRKDDAVEEEAEEVVTLDKVEEDYVEVLRF